MQGWTKSFSSRKYFGNIKYPKNTWKMIMSCKDFCIFIRNAKNLRILLSVSFVFEINHILLIRNAPLIHVRNILYAAFLVDSDNFSKICFQWPINTFSYWYIFDKWANNLKLFLYSQKTKILRHFSKEIIPKLNTLHVQLSCALFFKK